MEIDSLEECRALIRRRNEDTFLQRFRRRCLRLPSERNIGFGVMLCLLVSIAFLLAMQLYYSKGDLVVNFPELLEEDDETYTFNDTNERIAFLEEWKIGEKRLSDQREQLAELYEKVLLKGDTSTQKDMDLLFVGNETVPIKMVDCALILEHVKRTLKKCVSVDILPEECLKFLRNSIQCDPKYPYRTINGSCNNLINPLWGASGASYLRLLKPHYADDVSSLRISVYGVELPNPRLLSSRVFNRKLLPDAETTMLFMNYGLFLDHDLIKSLLPFKEIRIHCCAPEVKADPRLRHPSCGEIEVPHADAFFNKRNITCLNFYRSIPSIGTCPGRREQSNIMTAYLDLSDTYGPTDKESHQLRAFEGGKLRYSIIGNTHVMAFNNESGDTCYTRDARYKCFSSGDVRTNMHVEIMALHNIWFREHNRIAEKLQILNPHWSDEKIFQEARRINTAEFQHITYAEFLQNIFGKERMKPYGLEINPENNYDGYDETVQAGVYNAFASAAFRFGHSLVQSVMEFRGPDYKLRSVVPMHETYTNPSIIYKNGMDDIIRGMSSQRTHQPDRYTTAEIRNRLLQRYYSDYGLDLTMITLERGRDRGLPPYTKWRKFCALEEINSWDDMYKVMDKIRVEELRELYMSVHDVDLVSGGLSETHLEGALIGPTYACIIRRQFRNVRRGDRFWFENQGQAGSFIPAQLTEIYKSNFARILCDTSDGLETIQKFPFRISSKENPMVPCYALPKVDLSLWADLKN